jgi:hypothetical protein
MNLIFNSIFSSVSKKSQSWVKIVNKLWKRRQEKSLKVKVIKWKLNKL